MMKRVRPSEGAVNRKDQMDKRLRKAENLQFRYPVYKNAPHEEADLLIVGFNSTRGTIEEAISRLETGRNESKSCSCSFNSSVPSR